MQEAQQVDTLTAQLNVMSCDCQHTEWQTNVEGCNHETLQHSEFKFTWSCQLWSIVGISELETVIRWNAMVFPANIN